MSSGPAPSCGKGDTEAGGEATAVSWENDRGLFPHPVLRERRRPSCRDTGEGRLHEGATTAVCDRRQSGRPGSAELRRPGSGRAPSPVPRQHGPWRSPAEADAEGSAAPTQAPEAKLQTQLTATHVTSEPRALAADSAQRSDQRPGLDSGRGPGLQARSGPRLGVSGGNPSKCLSVSRSLPPSLKTSGTMPSGEDQQESVRGRRPHVLPFSGLCQALFRRPSLHPRSPHPSATKDCRVGR